ncbi:MAG: SDR family NAD(P)-dependent oxidoreductase [Nitrospinota bacterium]
MADYLVTGASSGIGRALARELVRRGHRVWGAARREELLAGLQQELGGDGFRFSVCDVGRIEDVRRAKSAMDRAGFFPEVIILNAGVNPEAGGTPFSLATFEAVTRVNLLGAMVWVEAFLSTYRARGRGQFAAISSLAAYRGDARWVAYCASKSALSRAFEALRARHRRHGVTFTTIHLGAADTGMGSGSRSPFCLTEERAVRRILAAIERRASSVTIPRSLRLIVELMRILPDAVFSRLVAEVSRVPDGELESRLPSAAEEKSE